LKGQVNDEQYVLSVLQKAFDKGQQGHMDTDTMIHWLKQELQLGYTTNQSEKAL
jgi:Ca2+-binding EF-hand superfamily protein